MGNSQQLNIENLRSKNYFYVLKDLIAYINSHKFKTGDKLPPESVLAAELNTNRSTLRESLRILEFMGVIDSHRGSGNVLICSFEVGFMNLLLFSNALENQKSIDMSSLRAAIESVSVCEFIDAATETDIFRLELLYEDMANAKDPKSTKYLKAHLEFHDLILKYYPNETAKQIIHANIMVSNKDFDSNYYGADTLSEQEKAYYNESISESSHLAILNAVKKRDKKLAQELVMKHCFISSMITL